MQNKIKHILILQVVSFVILLLYCSNGYSMISGIGAIQSAGNDTSITVCATETEIVLLDYLGGNPDDGGIWHDLDNSGGVSNGIFDASIVSTGVFYRLKYIVNVPSPDTSILRIKVGKAPNAGKRYSDQTCANADRINILAKNPGFPDGGGSWVDVDESGAMDGNYFDPSLSAPGEYSLYYVVEGIDPCTNNDTSLTVMTVKPTPQTEFEVSDVSYCEGLNVPILLSGSEQGVTYTLIDEDGLTVAENKGTGSLLNLIILQDHLEQGAQKFYVNASIGTSCDVQLSDSAVVKINPVPKPFIFGENDVCPFSIGKIYTVEYNPSYIYKWFINGGNPIGSTDFNEIVIDWGGPTLAKIKVVVKHDSTHCSSSNELDVLIRDQQKPTIESCPDDIQVVAKYVNGQFQHKIQDRSLDMIATDNCGNLDTLINDYNYTNTLRNVIFYVEDDTTKININWRATDYSYNISNCSHQIKIIINRKLVIPNLFTPNGDGYNDKWVIRQITDLYPNAIVKVYDVSGKLVFQSKKGYPSPWDGTYNGNPLGVDSYYYFIHYGDGYGIDHDVITIVR